MLIEAFQLFADALTQAVLLVSGTGEVFAANQRALESLGVSKKAELLGKNLAEFIIDPAESLQNYLRICSRSTSPFPGALRLRTQGGETLDCRCDGALLRLNGSPRSAIVLNFSPKETTVRRFRQLDEKIEELERKNREMRGLLNSVLMQMPAGVMIAEAPAGKIAMGNLQAELILGGTRPAPLEWLLARSLQKGETVENEEICFNRPDGETLTLCLNSAPVRDLDGKIVAGVSVFQDISRQKRMESELRKAIALRDEFLSIASHELRTPITSVKLQIQLITNLLRKGMLSQLNGKLLDQLLMTADRQLLRLTQLIANLLDVSLIRNNRLSLAPQKFDLAEVIEDAVECMASQAQQAGCTLSVAGAKNIIGNWDRNKIDQVVMNLVTNAIKYGAGKPIEIWNGSAYREGTSLAWIEVRDHGMGISSENQQRIFERFERAVSSTKISGLGLGLYISKQIVVAHGGKIDVQSRPGGGTIFRVELPLESKTDLCLEKATG